jgi:hypothetical protein
MELVRIPVTFTVLGHSQPAVEIAAWLIWNQRRPATAEVELCAENGILRSWISLKVLSDGLSGPSEAGCATVFPDLHNPHRRELILRAEGSSAAGFSLLARDIESFFTTIRESIRGIDSGHI